MVNNGKDCFPYVVGDVLTTTPNPKNAEWLQVKPPPTSTAPAPAIHHPAQLSYLTQFTLHSNMSYRGSVPVRPAPRMSLGTAFIYACAAGALGVAAMTVSEKCEQLITNRPNSYIPANTLAALLGLRGVRSGADAWNLNMIMHYGQGALVAGIRGVMSWYGIRGPVADFMFMGVRLLTDQTLENLAGVGTPPWYVYHSSYMSETDLFYRTWPVNEQVVDLLHKAVFAFVTGYVCDQWIQ